MIWVLIACTDKSVNADDTGDTAVSAATDIAVTLSTVIPTVATLTFNSDTTLATQVRFGTGAYERVTALDSAANTHSFVLYGQPPETEVAFTIEDDAGTALGSGTYTTGALSADLPDIEAEGSLDTWALTTLLGSSNGAIILGPDGQIVWYYPNTSGLDAFRARPKNDGSGIAFVVGDASGDPSDASTITSVSWDGTQVSALAVPYLAQDFVERDDSSLVAIATDVRTGSDGESVKGNALVQILPDGSYASIWSSWDCFDPATTPGNDPELGWTWANALDFDTASNSYMLGLRNFSAIVWIGAETLGCDTILGGELSDYTLSGDRFLHAHQFQLNGDSLLVFDNDGAGSKSRILEYTLDTGSMTATSVWDYTPDPSVFSFVLGDVSRLSDNSVLATFSVAGQIDRVTPAGERLFRVNTPVGHVFGYVIPLEAL